MFTPNRRDFLKLGLAVPVAATSIRQSGAALASDRPPRVGRVFSDIAGRLACLRDRRRHLGPPSPELIRALECIPRSVLVYDLAQVEENYLRFLEVDKDLAIHYAVKACPNPRILRKITSLGGGFDVASRAELDLALGYRRVATQVPFFQHRQVPSGHSLRVREGVVAFVADSEYEVRKLPVSRPARNSMYA